MDSPEIDRCRQEIDRLDREILDRLSQRADLAVEIGRRKKALGRPTLDPGREEEVVSRLLEQNHNPLAGDALRRIYVQIISACRALQSPVTVSYLGPEATFSHLAAREYFGDSAEFLARESIGDVFGQVETGQVDFGIVPVENSLEGAVSQTLDHLVETRLRVCGESYLRVAHALLSLEADLARIERVLSHPQALAQCRPWLAKNLPGGQAVETSSTAEAARRAAREPGSAAVGLEMLAELYGLKVLARNIQGRRINLTRFLILGRGDCSRTGRDKTSVFFTTPHQPGSLSKCLQPLARAGVNLTRIESRPSKQTPWEYVFFLDFEGHRLDEPVRAALESMAEKALSLSVLGSYPCGWRPGQGARPAQPGRVGPGAGS